VLDQRFALEDAEPLVVQLDSDAVWVAQIEAVIDPSVRTEVVDGGGVQLSLLGFRIVDGVVGAGFPQKPAHSAVFAQIAPDGSRLTDLARRANMSPQAMGELVDELEQLGYVVRRPDPTDRRTPASSTATASPPGAAAESVSTAA